MINRNLIRIRIVQIVYSWYQNTNKDLRNAEKELMFGLQNHTIFTIICFFLWWSLQICTKTVWILNVINSFPQKKILIPTLTL